MLYRDLLIRAQGARDLRTHEAGRAGPTGALRRRSMDMSMLETIETDAIAPRLSDGTAVSELIDFERREVSLRVHHDQEIFDLEMERIFTDRKRPRLNYSH